VELAKMSMMVNERWGNALKSDVVDV